MDKMPFTSRVMINPLQANLAKRLSSLAPGALRYSFFSNSGTESVEAALKIARFSTGRSQIIGTTNAFHGKTYGSLSASGRDIFKTPFSPLVPGFSHVAFGDIDAMSKAMNENVAAVILEPIQGEGGINLAPKGYLASVQTLCAEHGALLILDEVQTGMGRCGTLFACEQEGIEPDLLCLAKGLSGGVIPIGVTMGTNEVWTIFEENAFLHSSTFGGNPLACTAAMATLDVIENEGLCDNAACMGEYLLDQLNRLKHDFPNLIQDVRGRGLLIGVEFLADAVCARIISGLVDNGVIAGYTLNQPKVIRLEPPLIVNQEQCDMALHALKVSIKTEISR